MAYLVQVHRTNVDIFRYVSINELAELLFFAFSSTWSEARHPGHHNKSNGPETTWAAWRLQHHFALSVSCTAALSRNAGKLPPWVLFSPPRQMEENRCCYRSFSSDETAVFVVLWCAQFFRNKKKEKVLRESSCVKLNMRVRPTIFARDGLSARGGLCFQNEALLIFSTIRD